MIFYPKWGGLIAGPLWQWLTQRLIPDPSVIHKPLRAGGNQMLQIPLRA